MDPRVSHRYHQESVAERGGPADVQRSGWRAVPERWHQGFLPRHRSCAGESSAGECGDVLGSGIGSSGDEQRLWKLMVKRVLFGPLGSELRSGACMSLESVIGMACINMISSHIDLDRHGCSVWEDASMAIPSTDCSRRLSTTIRCIQLWWAFCSAP